MNYQEPEDVIASMLFADLKGYSALRDNSLKVRALQLLRDEVEQHILRPETFMYRNTWGDAYFICSKNPVALAEVALKMRDFVRTTDWTSRGFPNEFAARIGLHVDSVKVRYKPDGSVEDVIGTGVDLAARIEPITELDSVYCSTKFYDFLGSQSKIKGIPLGKKSLPKNFGEIELYQLLWRHESLEAPRPSPTPQKSIPMPAIKHQFGDLEKSEFLHASFQQIRTYFREALAQLEASHSRIQCRLKPLTDTKFVCQVYLDGKEKAKCKIWLDSHFGYEQIYYSQGLSESDDSNAHNESIRVETDGAAIFLKSSMNALSSYRGYDTSRNPATAEQIAEYLWTRWSGWFNLN